MLVLGPLVRHVDETTATVWVETDEATTVVVRAGDLEASAATFAVHGHHYALVDVEGLAPGTRTPYVVEVAGDQVWPEADSPFPAPVLATLDLGQPLRLAFGSCRVAAPHDAAGHARYGVDTLRAVGLGLSHQAEEDPEHPAPDVHWPHLVLMLGDQVYADETSEEMRAVIRGRRDPEQEPGYELKDYEEYAQLYRIAWRDPATRWLLSTLPSLMIFDDHDVRDDWNTSAAWRRDMAATSWWHDRIVGGLASYWVYQHLGNLTPSERAEDPLWRRVLDRDGPDELDLGADLDALAERADAEPDTYRWSYARDLGPQARLVVVDSRSARVLEDERRSMLDDEEKVWLEEQLRGDVEHLLIGTSLPFLMAPGFHHVEALVEVLAQGALGRRVARFGERVRRFADTEHWAAFQEGFASVGESVVSVATGERGRAPSTVCFLSGDVHHSYVAEAVPAEEDRRERAASRIVQAVCSPIRNPLPWYMRGALAVATRGWARPTGRLLGRLVPRSPVHWHVTDGPWFDNALAMLEIDETSLEMWWTTAAVRDGDHARPRLSQIARVRVEGADRGSAQP
ncbi:alkaline phosphatase D family protein [Nocardioides acrostichi]|uniref:alkaline phosphatase D family protein n=1 Tax=Nocardioides acrostichi TaxID=2784339 RepID=UPI002E27B874|nr:alkaline phosphatase D family protein [Nocardioides acrostichi]